MIYSCTMFLNEFHLLDLKIAEELPHVDKMIIVEACRTHSNKPRELMLRKRYADPKISIIEIGKDFGNHPTANEGSQRNAALQNVVLANDDIVICTDLDEINTSEDMPVIIRHVKEHGLTRIAMHQHYFRINLTVSLTSRWCLPFAVTGEYLKKNNKTLTDVRRKEREGAVCNTNGRHFGYLNDAEGIAYKIKSFLHTDKNVPKYTDLDQIEKRIRSHKDPYDRCNLIKVDLDDTFPKTILNHLQAWKKYIA